jgi:putative ABC transport system ATP-binding protein
MARQTVLEVVEDLEFHYPEDRLYRYRIPAGLVLGTGDAWCLHGISGSGKSTAMTLLAALRRLASGRIRYRTASRQALEVTPENWDAVVGPRLWRTIGFAFQRPELVRALAVEDNLALVLPAEDLACPALFSPEEWAHVRRKRVWELSGGQVQRLGLLRAFGSGQALVFLDEPTNNLDVRNREAVAEFVARQRVGRALVVVSHDEAFLATLGIDQRFEISSRQRADGSVVRELAGVRVAPPATPSPTRTPRLVAPAN